MFVFLPLVVLGEKRLLRDVLLELVEGVTRSGSGGKVFRLLAVMSESRVEDMRYGMELRQL